MSSINRLFSLLYNSDTDGKGNKWLPPLSSVQSGQQERRIREIFPFPSVSELDKNGKNLVFQADGRWEFSPPILMCKIILKYFHKVLKVTFSTFESWVYALQK